MKLEFLPLNKLVIGKTNMRYGKRAPDVADILSTVRKRGVLQPIIVRPAPAEPVAPASINARPSDLFEIVAGARRFTAARIVADERRAARAASAEDTDDVADDDGAVLPCAILDDGDDADAVEASLIENIARLDADEVTQWQTFTRLIREGRSVDDLSSTFGLPELAIKRVLALGNLLPRIRALYAAETIDRTTVRHLTLASKSQQKAWLALADDTTAHCPTGQQLKAWLFGGPSIPVRHALFDVEASGLTVIADLFGDDAYFADSDAFWVAQNAAIEARRDAYLAAGWTDAVIVPTQQHFATWEHEKVAKHKFGRVYLDVRSSGEVVIHEGYLTRREAERRARGGEDATETAARSAARPELTSTLQTYVDLHRHAAVRAVLLDHPGVALRLMVAHGIAGSHLFRVSADPQATRNPEVRDSLDNSRAEADFDARRRAVLALLGIDAEAATVIGGTPEGAGYDGAPVTIFYRLLDLPDPDVMEVLGVVIGEAMASGSAIVEAVGLHLGVAMADYWSADAAFLSLVRDRAVMTAIVADVAGDTVVKANAGETTATMKRIVADHIAGENGRPAVKNWVPRWMAFPPAAYTDRGGVGTVAAHAKAEAGRTLARDLGSGTPSDDAEPVPSVDARPPETPIEDGASPLSLAA